MENSVCNKIYVENRMVYILLPICVELNYDSFLSVLKNVVSRVGRAKMVEFYLDNALKTGMMADEIIVEEKDLTSNWKDCSSRQGLIRQSKLLGFWTTTNYPAFGKIFFGDSWQAPKQDAIKMNSKNNTKTMTAAEIEAIIFPKLKCQLVQLNVSESTLSHLKHFVKVPINDINIENEKQISPRMKCFDIKEGFAENCWAALKCGEWRKVSEQCFST